MLTFVLMLQFICESDNRFSQAELAQMAVEGGCRWVQLRFPENADPGYIREVTSQVIPLCREASVFLTVENLPETAKDYSVHGVHLTSGGLARGMECRELLGPEAIVSVQLATVADIDAAQKADLDFVTLPPEMPLEKCASIISTCRNAGLTIPVVATDFVTLDNLSEVMAAGFSGVAVGKGISGADDPEKRTEEFLAALA